MPTFEFNLKKIKNELKIEENEKLAEIIESFKPEVEEISDDKIKVTITPDRIDLFFEEGFLKALKDFVYGGSVKRIDLENSKLKVYYTKEVKTRPYFSCFVVKNLKLNEALLKKIIEFQETLHKHVGRNRKLVAIGLHDLDKIEGEIYYREASSDEKMVPLTYEMSMSLKEILEVTEKGKEYASLVREPYPVICDKSSIISFPPILNSEKTKLTAVTKNIFVDITGIDERVVEITTKILIYFFSFFGRPEKVILNDKEFPNIENEIVRLKRNNINKILGLNLSSNEIKDLLEKMGYDVMIINEEDVNVIVPFYRVDFLHERDIIEDVAIAYGYNNFKPKQLRSITVGKIHEREKLENMIREILIGAKLLEIITPTFISERILRLSRIKEVPTRVINPVSEEYDVLRNYLFPSVLLFLSKNTSREYPQNVFEIGYTVNNLEEYRKLCIAICYDKANLSEIISILEELFKNLKIRFNLKKSNLDFFINGRQAFIIIDNKIIGFCGEIHPEILSDFEIFMPVVIAEINLSLL